MPLLSIIVTREWPGEMSFVHVRIGEWRRRRGRTSVRRGHRRAADMIAFILSKRERRETEERMKRELLPLIDLAKSYFSGRRRSAPNKNKRILPLHSKKYLGDCK